MKRLLGLLGDNTKEVSVAEKAIGGQRWVAVVGGSACFLCGGGPQKKESCRRNIVTSLRKSVPRDTPYPRTSFASLLMKLTSVLSLFAALSSTSENNKMSSSKLKIQVQYCGG
jgi:hypothetical protein